MAVDPLPLDFGRTKRFCVYVYFDPRHRKAVIANAMRTAKKLALADPLWRDRRYTVDQISEKCGFTRATLYRKLGPRWSEETQSGGVTLKMFSLTSAAALCLDCRQ